MKNTSGQLFKKLIFYGFIIIGLVSLIGNGYLGLGIITSNNPNGITSSTTATLYDESKANGATAIRTDGWDEKWVDKFRINAGDPPYVDGEYIDTFLKKYYPASPLIGQGDNIVKYSNQYGIAVGTFLGVVAKETTFGINACGGRYNIGCVMWTEGSPFPSTGNRPWINPPNIESAIENWFRLVREVYVDQGRITYKDFLNVYSPTFENDHATFKDKMWGVLKSFGYDVEDRTEKSPSGSSSTRGCSPNNRYNNNYLLSNFDYDNSRLTNLTLSWKEPIRKEMNRQGVSEDYLPLLLGILQIESGGGGVTDIFQSSEFRGLPINTLSTEESIIAGVEAFKQAQIKADSYGKSLWAIPAGYNFGDAFLDYLRDNNTDWTIEVAEKYSKEVVAPSLGNHSGEKLSYNNQVSRSYNKPYYYRNGGNFHYVPMLMYYLGFDLDEIEEVALKGSQQHNQSSCYRILFGKYRFDNNKLGENGDIIEIALSINGYWTYSQPNRLSVLNNIDPPNMNDQTDCSGFVYWVLKKGGYKLPAEMWWTGFMQDDINGTQQYLQKIEANETQAGDIIIQHYPNQLYLAHTAILLEPWHGPNTKIIQVGGAGSGVNQSIAGMSGLGNPTSFGRAIPAGEEN